MHRVELKARKKELSSCQWDLFLMHRVELKVGFWRNVGKSSQMIWVFLMHRVELKV
jgi:hypothetical protein